MQPSFKRAVSLFYYEDVRVAGVELKTALFPYLTSAGSIAHGRPNSHSMGPVMTKQHPDWWFPDGSIVVLAQDTGFRVHMSLLARHSPVFRDVFALPQPAKLDTDDDASLQGVPFVEVSDDVYDMSCMLHVIYDGPK